jgi:hypothetical protein
MTHIIEVEADGSLRLPKEVLAEAKPATRYIVETQGNQLTLRPEEIQPSATPESREQWLAAWRTLSEQIGKSWIGDKSALEELAEMRR